jgi:hypothetical protein
VKIWDLVVLGDVPLGLGPLECTCICIVSKVHGGKCRSPHTGSKGGLGLAPAPFLRVNAVLCMHSPPAVSETLDWCLHYRSCVCHFLLGPRIRPNFLDHLLVLRCNLGLLALTLAPDGFPSEFTLLLITGVLLWHMFLPSITLLGLCQSVYLTPCSFTPT